MDGRQADFRLFGEIALYAVGQPLDVGAPRQQAVLAALLVDAGRPVAVETLVDRVWDDEPPAGARNILYSHMSRIRRLLRLAAERTGGTVASIERRHAGYVLDVDPDLVDLHRFRRLVETGRDPRCEDGARAAALAEALSLWRGPPLAALSGEWVTRVRAAWYRQRLDAAVLWAELKLRLGSADEVVVALADLTTDYPHAEPLEGLLMRGLHEIGRDAEALDRYSVFRQRLADELGTDPSEELRDLHRALLRGELRAPSRLDRPVAHARASPAQLPPDVPGFAGREGELNRLDNLLTATDAVVMIAIDGTAGVGKTTFAVHWAQRVRGLFPDGQLYLNLRGFDPTGSPVTPSEALRAFLDAFDVPGERIPFGLEAQIGLYRSVLAGRRALVLLDNARDTEQVRPLLPGAPGCLVMVTSRNALTGLVTAGAHPLTLDLLTTGESRQLLAGRLGPDRVSAEPQAVDEIIRLCTRLPLALSIVAARAATHPAFGLAALADQIHASSGPLDEFAGEDPAIDARAVFSWSYRRLSPAAARLFRLLGLHHGPDVATPAAASLAGLTVSGVRPLLSELARAHLVAEHVPGRFACHDLLRAYAAELARTVDTEADRGSAIRRMLDHYVYSGFKADRLLNPYPDDDAIELAPTPPGISVEEPMDRAQALAWFGKEQPVFMSAVRRLTGFDVHLWRLVRFLRRYLAYQGFWFDQIEVLSVGLEAARRLGDPLRQAFAHRFLGCTRVAIGRYDTARADLERAAELYKSAGDRAGEAHVHRHFAWMLERQGLHREALPHARRALELYRAAGDRAGQARALNAISWFHAKLGDPVQALRYCGKALRLQEKLGDRFGQAETRDSLGYLHHHLGEYRQAVESYQMAVELYREFDDRYNEADTLVSLGETHLAAGDRGSALAVWQRALGIFDRLGHPAADDVLLKLKAHGRPSC